MDDLARDRDANPISPSWLFVIKHQPSESCRHKTGKNGCNATSKLSVGTAAPKHREPAIETADTSGNNAGRGPEDQARRITETMALLLQASLLLRGPAALAGDAFTTTRIGGDWGHTLGTIPAGIDTKALLTLAQS